MAALLVLVIVLENTMQPTSMLFTVLKKGAVYALVAASLNLLNGFTGLFSLGQAGFMLLGAYTYAILTIPSADRESVYYLYGGSAVNFSLPELFGGGALGLILGVLAALILAGCVAAVIAWLIGLPVLRLKSDYLAIATLGFAEIIRAIFQWDRLGPVTNGANALKSFPTFSSFNIENANGEVVLRLSTFVPFLLVAVCIGIMVLLINSTYGRAFKAIREDEVAAEAMGINLAKHKRMAFCISSFFAERGRRPVRHVRQPGPSQDLHHLHDLRDPADRGDRRHRVHLRQLHRLVPVRGGQRVVAAVPGHGDVYRRLQGALPADRLPDGGVLHHHHDRGAVLPPRPHGGPGAL